MIKLLDGKLYQYDLGRKIEIIPKPNGTVLEVRFRSGGQNSFVVPFEVENGRAYAEIPNFMLKTFGILIAVTVEIDNDGDQYEQRYSFVIEKREKPADYEYIENEVITLNDLKKNESSGTEVEGTIQITENGTHDVAEYASAEVNIVYSGEGVPVETYDRVKSTLDGVIDRSIVAVSGDFESVGLYAFSSCGNLTTADFPLLTTVGAYAFYNCNNLETADFPLVTDVSGYAFSGCTKLKNVNLPLIKKIPNNMLKNCKALTTVDFPLVTDIESYAFESCTSLTSVYFPLVTKLGNSSTGGSANAFQSCTNLVEVDFPLATTVGNYVFYKCSSLTTVNLPLVEYVYGYGLAQCVSLEKIDFPLLKSISGNAFASDNKLKTLILRGETVCTLSSVNAFSGTPFASGGTGGTVYVPQELIEQYKTATNWSTLYAQGTCNFVAIEGSEYE